MAMSIPDLKCRIQHRIKRRAVPSKDAIDLPM